MFETHAISKSKESRLCVILSIVLEMQSDFRVWKCFTDEVASRPERVQGLVF